jgi:hypothetical protein
MSIIGNFAEFLRGCVGSMISKAIRRNTREIPTAFRRATRFTVAKNSGMSRIVALGRVSVCNGPAAGKEQQ